MSVRLYRCNRIPLDSRPGWKSALCRYITGGPGGNGDFDSLNAPGKAFYDLASCDTATHDLAASDPDIVILSPEFTKVRLLREWMSGQLGSVQQSTVSAIESDGIPLDDLTATSTRAMLLRRIGGYHQISRLVANDLRLPGSLIGRWRDSVVANAPRELRQDALQYCTAREIDVSWVTPQTPVVDVLNYISTERRNAYQWLANHSLSTPMSDIPVEVRSRFAQWMRHGGLDVSWMGANTTVRQVVKRILVDLVLPPSVDMNAGKYERIRL